MFSYPFVCLLRAIRLLWATREFVRALTSVNRFLHEFKEVQSPKPIPKLDVGIMIACVLKEMLQSFAAQFISDTTEEMQCRQPFPFIKSAFSYLPVLLLLSRYNRNFSVPFQPMLDEFPDYQRWFRLIHHFQIIPMRQLSGKRIPQPIF